MLSNITNYLFGGNQNNENAETENFNFHEVEEDDWMVIDKLADKHSHGSDDLIVSSELYVTQPTSYLKAENQHLRPPVPEKSSRRRSISCKRLVNRRCSTPLRELSPACVNTKAIVPYVPHKESRSSSKSSLCGMEESWYITPPPCFVSGPYETKPSSLENLLIEQPGVSFLKSDQSDPLKQRLINNKDVGKIETPKLPPRNMKKEKVTVIKEKENSQNEDKRRQLLEIHEQKKFINACQSQLNSSQKVEQKLPDQFCKRNQMERLNKVQYELSSRKKRQRRADLNKKHSGVNNNRKCCY